MKYIPCLVVWGLHAKCRVEMCTYNNVTTHMYIPRHACHLSYIKRPPIPPYHCQKQRRELRALRALLQAPRRKRSVRSSIDPDKSAPSYNTSNCWFSCKSALQPYYLYHPFCVAMAGLSLEHPWAFAFGLLGIHMLHSHLGLVR